MEDSLNFNFNFNFSGMQETKVRPLLDKNETYDVLILGAGPAGLTSAVYCARKGLKIGIITKNVGGQVTETHGIQNYMGYINIHGIELMNKFRDQVKQFDIPCKEGVEIQKIEDDRIKKVYLEDGSVYKAKTIIVSTGKKPRKLNIPGEDDYIGKGVTYCAICDGPLFKDKEVVISGGGNSAVGAAIDLSKIIKRVYLVHRSKFRADKMLVEKLKNIKNIDIMLEHNILEIKGNRQVERVQLEDKNTGEKFELETAGVLIEIGLEPNTEPFKNILELNSHKEIIIDNACCTNKEGIFAAGDVTDVPFKQIIIAGGEGAKAALSANDYIVKFN